MKSHTDGGKAADEIDIARLIHDEISRSEVELQSKPRRDGDVSGDQDACGGEDANFSS